MVDRPVRWAVVGTANIAAHAFLPALRAAGGDAVVVGSRDRDRGDSFASAHGVSRVGSYADAVSAPDVDAVYVALPNDQHTTWAAAAVHAGKAVLCEKPLGLDAGQVDALLADVGRDALLWEAFVFPFHPQTRLLTELTADGGPLGRVREMVSEFHFTVSRPDNIRWNPRVGGGALLDVGCYPLRLARLLFRTEPERAVATAFDAPSGVDAEVAAVLDFPGDRRLLLSAGMRGAPSTFTRIVGADAELRLTNPFHPTADDGVELWRAGRLRHRWPAAAGTVFQHAIEHVHDVLRNGARPRHRAVDDAQGNARGLDLIRAAMTATGDR